MFSKCLLCALGDTYEPAVYMQTNYRTKRRNGANKYDHCNTFYKALNKEQQSEGDMFVKHISLFL